MLKAFRQMKESVAAATSPESEEQKRVSDIRDVAEATRKSFQAYYRDFVQVNHVSASLNLNLGSFYPANQRLTPAIIAANESNNILEKVNAEAASVQHAVDKSLQFVISKCDDLSQKISRRTILLAEITHYKDKIVKLANEALKDDQKQQKAESNQSKLAANLNEYKTIEEDIASSLSGLDNLLAESTNEALTRHFEFQATYAASLMQIATAAVGSIGLRSASSIPVSDMRVVSHVMSEDTPTESISLTAFTEKADIEPVDSVPVPVEVSQDGFSQSTEFDSFSTIN